MRVLFKLCLHLLSGTARSDLTRIPVCWSYMKHSEVLKLNYIEKNGTEIEYDWFKRNQYNHIIVWYIFYS